MRRIAGLFFMSKQALILVDIQNDYFTGGNMVLKNMEAAGTNAVRLLKFFRDRDWPRIHIQHVSTRPGATFFIPQTAGVEIHPVVAPIQGEAVLTKHYPNSFRDTGLQEKLRQADVTKLAICGAMSHMCIDTTTRAAFDLGFECTVLHDACATRDLKFGDIVVPADQVHASFMAALAGIFAKVQPVSEFVLMG